MLALFIEYAPIIASLLAGIMLPVSAISAQRKIVGKLSAGLHHRRERKLAATETRYGPGVPIRNIGKRQFASH